MAEEQPQSPRPQWLLAILQPLVRWTPIGGSGLLFVHFLLQQQWAQAVLTFPATVIAGVWAAYSQSFIDSLQEIYRDRAKADANALVGWLDSLDQAVRWQLSGFEQKYLRCQAHACRDYTIEGFQPAGVWMPMLAEVFVPLELSDVFVRNRQGDVLPGWPGLQRRQLDCEGLTIWDLLSQIKRVPAYRSLVILAWGGYGKTTLLRHITYVYTHQKYRQYKVPPLIPILLYLRKWRDLLAQANAPSLPDLITEHHLKELPEGEGLLPPPNWAKQLLQQGKALVMLDGFDEVAEEQRPAASQWISRQMGQYPKAVFMLTSRPGGYAGYGGQKPKTSLWVKPFNDEQQARFIKQWYLCQERIARGGRNTPDVRHTATKNAEALIQQIQGREELQGMAKNPLMLNMIATFHRFYPNNELPQRRAELYQEICLLQLGARPLARRIEMCLGSSQEAVQKRQAVLQAVALAMVQAKAPKVKAEKLLPYLQKLLQPLDETLDAGAFLKQIVEVSELLVERDAQEYEFAHLSFRNYLAAAQIKKTKQESLLLKNFAEDSWREPILLYAAQLEVPELTRFVQAFCQIGTREAAELAYACLQETPRRIDPSLEAELEALRQVRQSVQNLRYQALENYLEQGQWREADKETDRVMLETVGKTADQYLNLDDIHNFPCEDLRIIDQLWVKYSDGKFGFSVQKKIWQECGSPTSYNDDWKKFGTRVGWKNVTRGIDYPSGVTFSTTARHGHLPLVRVLGAWRSVLFSRVQTCRL